MEMGGREARVGGFCSNSQEMMVALTLRPSDHQTRMVAVEVVKSVVS